MNLLEQPTVLSIRKNHALEHATIRVLSNRFPHISMAGYSDQKGFWIIGDVNGEDLRTAVDEAVKRLNEGESQLAFHPNCGTNFAVMGIAAGLAAWVASLGAKPNWKNRFDRLPNMILFSTAAMIFSQPYAHQIQIRFTTKAAIGSLRVLRIEDSSRGSIPAHRIYTTDQPEE